MSVPGNEKLGPWDEESHQDSFDDLLFAEERVAWAARRKCRHCYVWGHDSSSGMFFIACAHGCGSIRHQWKSVDHDGDLRRVKATQEAYAIAHAHGCPRDTSRLPMNVPGNRLRNAGRKRPRG